MRRRELLRTTGFVGGLALAGRSGTDSADPAGAPLDSWPFEWLPPSLVTSDATYAVAVAPTTDGSGPVDTARRFLSLTTDQTLVTVGVGADRPSVRERLRAAGHDRLSGSVEAYGRSGRRYRATALPDGGVVTGVGPAPEPVVDRVLAVARANGSADPGGSLAETAELLGTGRHLSIDVRPAEGIAGVGERLVVGDERSRLRTVVLPAGRDTADSYLRSPDDVDGLVDASTFRRGRATVREATVRTDAVRDRPEVGR